MTACVSKLWVLTTELMLPSSSHTGTFSNFLFKKVPLVIVCMLSDIFLGFTDY